MSFSPLILGPDPSLWYGCRSHADGREDQAMCWLRMAAQSAMRAACIHRCAAATIHTHSRGQRVRQNDTFPLVDASAAAQSVYCVHQLLHISAHAQSLRHHHTIKLVQSTTTTDGCCQPDSVNTGTTTALGTHGRHGPTWHRRQPPIPMMARSRRNICHRWCRVGVGDWEAWLGTYIVMS